jgi:CHASE2 domain-containing sensor protein
MNPHKKYALTLIIGSVVVIALALAGATFFMGVWFFPIVPSLMIRWAALSFRRLAAKRALQEANRPTIAVEKATEKSQSPDPS